MKLNILLLLNFLLTNSLLGQFYGDIDTLNKMYVLNNTLEKYEALSMSRLESKEISNYDFYIYERIKNYSKTDSFTEYSQILSNFLSKNKVELNPEFENCFQRYLDKYAVIKLSTNVAYKKCRPDFFVIPNLKNDTVTFYYYLDENCKEYELDVYPEKEIILAINKERYPNYKNFKFIHNQDIIALDFKKNDSIKVVSFEINSHSCRSFTNSSFTLSKGNLFYNVQSNHFKNPNLEKKISDYYWYILMNKLDFNQYKSIKVENKILRNPYIYSNNLLTIKTNKMISPVAFETYSIKNPETITFDKDNKDFYEFIVELWKNLE
ncbi:MAG: hypothetical protein MUE53_07675 [Chitinophagales bacterium]|jgi:hypothetical protein|nr:hypothetical protein [Chitinophagales bacterium]